MQPRARPCLMAFSAAGFMIRIRKFRTSGSGSPPKPLPHAHNNPQPHPTPHDAPLLFFLATRTDATPAGTLEMFLELLRATHGAKVLRLKGIAKLAEMPDTPVVVHGVQHVFHPTARLDCW